MANKRKFSNKKRPSSKIPTISSDYSFETQISELKKHRPYYFRIFETPKFIQLIPLLVRPVILATVIYVSGILVAILTADLKEFIGNWYFSVGCVFFALGSILILNAYQKAITTLTYSGAIITRDKDLKKLQNLLHMMFYSRWQAVFSILGSLAGISIFFLFGASELGYSPFLMIYIAFILFAINMLLFPGLWLIGSSYRLIVGFSQFRDLKLNPINLSGTLGMKKLAALLGTYSISFATQIVIAFVTTMSFDWPFKGTYMYQLIMLSLLTVFITLIITYFLFPQLALRGLIKQEREQRIRQYDILIQELFAKESQLGVGVFRKTLPDNLVEIRENLELIALYKPLYESLVHGRDFPFDISAWIKIAGAIILFIGTFHEQYSAVIEQVPDFFKHLMKFFELPLR